MNKQVEKLIEPFDKFSFQQQFTETDFFPETMLQVIQMKNKMKIIMRKRLKITISQ